MKNFKLLCMLAIMTSFSAVSTIDKADREKDQINSSEKILPKVKLFQEFAKAFPRAVSNFVAMYKGIATFSSEPQEVKDCAMAVATLTEESKNITTESQAQEFALKLMNKIEQCSQVAVKDVEQIVKENKNLPYVKVIQQAMEAYPEEAQHLIFNMAFQNEASLCTEENRTVLISVVHQNAKELTDEILNIEKEEEAQAFIEKLIQFIQKNQRFV